MIYRTLTQQKTFKSTVVRLFLALLWGGVFILWPETMVKIAVWGNLGVLVPLNLIIMALLAFR